MNPNINYRFIIILVKCHTTLQFPDPGLSEVAPLEPASVSAALLEPVSVSAVPLEPVEPVSAEVDLWVPVL